MVETEFLLIHQLSIISFTLVCLYLYVIFNINDDKSLTNIVFSYFYTGTVLIPMLILTPTVIFDLFAHKNYLLKYTLTFIYTGVFHILAVRKIIIISRNNRSIKINKFKPKTNNVKSNIKELNGSINNKNSSILKNNESTKIIPTNNLNNEYAFIKNSDNIKNKTQTSRVFERDHLQDEIRKISGDRISLTEMEQIINYINIFKENKCKHHWEVNEIISLSNKWDDFTALRSLNTHKNGSKVKGITPFHFYLICELLKITADDGTPLIKSEKY